MAVHDRDRVAGIVHEELLASPVFLPQHQIQLAAPAMVQITELTVLIALRIRLLVLIPEQHQGHMFVPAALLMDGGEVGEGTWVRGRFTRGRKQPVLNRPVIPPLRQWPSQTGSLGPVNILGHGTAREGTATGNLPIREMKLKLQA